MNGDETAIEEERFRNACRAILKEILETGLTSKRKLVRLKAKYCKKFSLSRMPKNAHIIEIASEDELQEVLPLLRRRKTRTLSGVSVIAVMTKPIPCPGMCVYCPGIDSQPGEPVAQSYTGREPAALRSIMNNYDPYQQVVSRIDDLEAIGHVVDKIELIIMGGTFLASSEEFRMNFMKGCINGILGKKMKTLDEAKRAAETSKRRLIGVTFETRPDYCHEGHVDAMLSYGGTRVEIGVQNTDDSILNIVHRGHSVSSSKRAIRVAKDAGFKVCLHLMPNLPGSSISTDRKMFETIFTDPAFKPDYLKIYPCLVIGGTILEKWWKSGTYQPYPTQDLVKLLAEVKAIIPEWIRIQRVQRDIPSYLILDGVKKSNLRELIWDYLDEHELNCNCIRCNEFGFNRKTEHDIPSMKDLEMSELFYNASEGREAFISLTIKDTKVIVGYIRMRQPSRGAHRIELSQHPCSIIREIRVVGQVVGVHQDAIRKQLQHRGLGKLLMSRAEQVALEQFNSKKLAVIAGIGARPYFYKLGYKPDGPYVSKGLSSNS